MTSINSIALLSSSSASSVNDKQINLELMRTWVEALPRLIPITLGPVMILEMISRYTFHSDEGLRIVSAEALKRIAQLKDQSRFWVGQEKSTNLVSERVARIYIKTITTLISERFLEWGVECEVSPTTGFQTVICGALRLYVDIVDIWINDWKEQGDFEDVDRTLEMVEELESKGLLPLCSMNSSVRRCALEILRRARDIHKTAVERAQMLPKPHSREARKSLRRTASRLQKHRSTVIAVVEDCGNDLVIKHYYDPVSAHGARGETRSAKAARHINKNALIAVIECDDVYDRQIWMRCQSDFFRLCLEYCLPKTVAMTLVEICSRLVILHPGILTVSEQNILFYGSSGSINSLTSVSSKVSMNVPKWANVLSSAKINQPVPINVTIDEVVEQWRIYLTFVCACIEINRTERGAKIFASFDRASKVVMASHFGSIRVNTPFRDLSSVLKTPKLLFQAILPLLSSEKASIRQGAVSSFGAINSFSYDVVFDDIQPLIKNVIDDIRNKYGSEFGPKSSVAQRARSSSVASAASSIKRGERLRMELTHLLSLIADFVRNDTYRRNEKLMVSVVTYIREVGRFLADPEIQLEWDHQMLRYYFCGLVERFYENLTALNTTIAGEHIPGQKIRTIMQQFPHSDINETIERYFPFEVRYSLFKLFEGWCGYGQMSDTTRNREARMMQTVLDQVKDIRERGALTSTMEEQRKALETAALKAMAALCKGSLQNSSPLQRGRPSLFDMQALFNWIDSIFGSPDGNLHEIAKTALENLLLYNPHFPALYEDVIRMSYTGNPGNISTKGYFMAIVENLCRMDADMNRGLINSSSWVSSLDNTQNSNNPEATSTEVSLAHWLWTKRCQFLGLALFKAGDSSSDVRKGVIKILNVIENTLVGKYDENLSVSQAKKLNDEGFMDEEEMKSYESNALNGSLPVVFKSAQVLLSSRFSQTYQDITHEVRRVIL